MDADADNHSKEGIPLFGVYAHIMKMIIIQDPVIHPLTGSAVIVNFLVFWRSSWNGSVKADVPVRFCVDTAAVRRGRTFFPAGAGGCFAADKRAAPFAGMLLLTVPPVDHTETGHTQWGAVFINGDRIRDGIRAPPVGIKVNKRPDIPFLAEGVSGIVVMGRVQADIPDRDIWVNGFKFPEGDDGADAVMASGIQEADMQGQVNTDGGIVCAEHVKSVAKIKSFFIAVPAPVGIRIGEMAFTGTARDTIFQTVTYPVTIRGGMGMDAGAVAGKGESVPRDESVLKGGEDGGKTKNLLEPFFIMEGELRVPQGVVSYLIRDAGMLIGKLFPFAGLFGRLTIFILWEKVFPAGLLGVLGLCPEPVHKIEVRTKRWKGIRGTADESCKQTVGF